MKHKLVFLLLIALFYPLKPIFGQRINYTIPNEIVKEVSKEDYKKIVDIAVPIVQKKYKIASINEGTILLEENQGMQALNLHNVALKCVEVKDKKLWQNIVQEHFTKLFLSIDEKKKNEADKEKNAAEKNKIDFNNFENAKKYLSLCIYPKETIMERGGADNLVFTTDLEGTYTVLMLNLPDAFAGVEKPAFDLWKKNKLEVFKIAQVNINKETVTKVTKKFDIDNSEIEVSFIANEDYAASYALDLVTNSPELVGKWGSLVVIPNRGIVNICKISKEKPADFVKFIQKINPMIEKSYINHVKPVSKEYFWYYESSFTKINVLTDAKGNVTVISPFRLTELMIKK